MSQPLPPRNGQPQPRNGSNRPVLIIVGVIAAVLLLGGGTWALVAATSEEKADTPEDLVEQAVEAASDSDVDALLALVCDGSSLNDYRDEATDANNRVADALDGEDPDLTYEIDEIDGDEVTVRVESSAESIDGSFAEMVLTVEEDDGTYCVDDIEVTDGDYTG